MTSAGPLTTGVDAPDEEVSIMAEGDMQDARSIAEQKQGETKPKDAVVTVSK